MGGIDHQHWVVYGIAIPPLMLPLPYSTIAIQASGCLGVPLIAWTLGAVARLKLRADAIMDCRQVIAGYWMVIGYIYNILSYYISYYIYIYMSACVCVIGWMFDHSNHSNATTLDCIQLLTATATYCNWTLVKQRLMESIYFCKNVHEQLLMTPRFCCFLSLVIW